MVPGVDGPAGERVGSRARRGRAVLDLAESSAADGFLSAIEVLDTADQRLLSTRRARADWIAGAREGGR
jgi:hypothetical protein